MGSQAVGRASSYSGGKRRPARGSASHRRRIRRRRAVALALVAAVALTFAWMLVGDWPGRPGSGKIALVSGGRPIVGLTSARAAQVADGSSPSPLAAERIERVGRATIALRVDVGELRSRLAEAKPGEEVAVPERAVSSRIQAPVIKQTFPNNCETAALSMLLASVGVARDQEDLQRKIAHDGPLDPVSRPGGERVWGNPDRGFVGRVEGGGAAGGFGVYQGPVAELARRWRAPVDLSGRDPQAIYRRLLEGHAVMTWVGLSDGPYESWVDERGERVGVNYGEHTVVLVGVRGDQVLVNDPLDGRFERWSKQRFEAMWKLLDRRAVSL